MKQYLIATIISLLSSTAFSEVVTAPTDQRVNPKVLAHQATLMPGLQKLGIACVRCRVYGLLELSALSKPITGSLW
jgi:hypothetical protein